MFWKKNEVLFIFWSNYVFDIFTFEIGFKNYILNSFWLFSWSTSFYVLIVIYQTITYHMMNSWLIKYHETNKLYLHNQIFYFQQIL
jgi:hypothetical protein